MTGRYLFILLENSDAAVSILHKMQRRREAKGTSTNNNDWTTLGDHGFWNLEYDSNIYCRQVKLIYAPLASIKWLGRLPDGDAGMGTIRNHAIASVAHPMRGSTTCQCMQ